jgi:GH35 family endo-1,4-beta-xylanase
MNNTELYINGRLVDAGGDLGVRLNRKLIDPGALNTVDAQFSYNISLPPTQVNVQAFDYASIEETRDKFNRVYNAELIVDSVRIFGPGLFRLTSITDGFKGQLYMPKNKTIKDIFGELKLNQNAPMRLPFLDFTEYVNLYNNAAATAPQAAIFPYVLYGVLPKVPINKDANQYSARGLWDASVRLGIADLPPAINPLLMLQHIFHSNGYDLQGTAFQDDKLTQLYQTYKNAPDYVQPWNYGYHAAMRLHGGWSSRTNKRSGVVGDLERGVNQSSDQTGGILACDLFDATNTQLTIDIDRGGNILYKEINDNNGKTWVNCQVRIPVAGYYKIKFNASISVDQSQDWRATDPVTGVQHVGGRTSNAVNDFNDNLYGMRLVRDRVAGDFGISGAKLDGSFYYDNQPQNEIFNEENIPKYFPQVDANGQVNFVDAAQDNNIVLGFEFGRHANASTQYINPRDTTNKLAQVMAAKPSISWDTAASSDKPTRLAIQSPGFWKYGRINSFDNEGDNPNINIDYSAAARVNGAVLDANGNPEQPPIVVPTTFKDAGFPMGFVTKRGQTDNPTYAVPLKAHVRRFTLENDLKSTTVRPNETTFNYSYADPQIIWAKANGLTVHGHCLLWAKDAYIQQYIKDFETSGPHTEDEWKAKLKSIIQAPILYYKNTPAVSGVIKSWDVVNEIFLAAADIDTTARIVFKDCVWLRVLGPQYISLAFQYAHEADPDAVLFANEYGWEFSWKKVDEMERMASEFIAAGVPMHGWGLQLHTDINLSDNSIRNNLQRMANTGMKIHISEVALSVRVGTIADPFVFTPELEAAQAAKYVTLFNAFLTLVPVAQQFGITTWGINDGGYWKILATGNKDYPLLLKDDFTTHQGYRDALSEVLRLNGLPTEGGAPSADNPNIILNRFPLQRYYTYVLQAPADLNYTGYAFIHNGAETVPILVAEFINGRAVFDTSFSPITVFEPKLTIYLKTSDYDVDGELVISRTIAAGSESVVDWELTDKYGIDLIGAPINYARRGQYNGAAADANWFAQGSANAVVWLEAGELLSVASVSSEGRYRREGMHSTYGWASHELLFDLSIEPFRVDPEWLRVDLRGNGTKAMNWGDPVNFDVNNINLVGFLDADMKTDEYIDNFCKAFNLSLYQIGANTFSLDLKQSKTATSSLYVDLDQIASVSQRENAPLGLPSQYVLGFTIDTEEQGYAETGETGGGTFDTGTTEDTVVTQTSLFSYNWYKAITKVEAAGNIVINLPIVSKSEAWDPLTTYPDAMKNRYTDLAQRFMYYAGILPGTYQFNGSALQIANVINQMPGVSILNYKNEIHTILSNYFTLLISGASHYTIIKAYLSPAQYTQLDGTRSAKFNGDLYYVAELTGYDPNNKNQTTIKLIRKI